jgi:death-on-curing protein
MISLTLVINIHEILIDKFGGIHGIRDMQALDAAINRPFATFDKVDLYPTPIEKSAALLESLVTNHPFIDGNKRIGYVMMRLFLLNHKTDISASEDEKYDFVLRIANGNITFDQICKWISDRVFRI